MKHVNHTYHCLTYSGSHYEVKCCHPTTDDVKYGNKIDRVIVKCSLITVRLMWESPGSPWVMTMDATKKSLRSVQTVSGYPSHAEKLSGMDKVNSSKSIETCKRCVKVLGINHSYAVRPHHRA